MGGVKDVVTENSAFTFESGDEKEFAVKLLQLSGDKNLRQKMGDEGRKFVMDRFSAERLAYDTKKLYLELLKNSFEDMEYVTTSNSAFYNSDHSASEVYKDDILKSASFTQYGPIIQNISSNKILSDHKMFISGQPNLANAVYICDIYEYRKEIQLPTTAAAGIVTNVSPEGFSNYSNQTPGYHFGSSTSNNNNTTTLLVLTYKIHVKYNIVLQNVNRVYPSNLNNVNNVSATYFYFAP